MYIYMYIYISNCMRQTRHRALTPDKAEKKYLTCVFRLGVFMYIYRYIWQRHHTCTYGSCPRALPQTQKPGTLEPQGPCLSHGVAGFQGCTPELWRPMVER